MKTTSNRAKSIKKRSKQEPLKPKKSANELLSDITAEQFVKKLKTSRSSEEAKKYLRYFKTDKGEYSEMYL